MLTLSLIAVALLLSHGCSSLDLRRGETPTPPTKTAAVADAATGAAATAPGAIAGSPCTLPVPARLPKHVFLIVFENQDYENTFGAKAPASYLRDLAKTGVLLTQYYGVGHNSLDNYIALISGQAPNLLTQADCPRFINFIEFKDANEEIIGQLKLKIREHFDEVEAHESSEAKSARTHYGQALGVGCVYPKHVITVADQLARRPNALDWRAYMEDMPTRCRHPGIDKESKASDSQLYAVRHNPFAYFHSLIDDGTCDKYDRPLGSVKGDTPGLIHDLDNEKPPAFVFISPNLCNDGHNDCDGKGNSGKLARISAFLRLWVPRIEESRTYREDGMIIITFDEAEVSFKVDKETLEKNRAASVRCCNEPPGPLGGNPGIFGPGGGRVGAIILSSRVEPGTENAHEFNHYSLLRSIEDLFNLDHLGYAGAKDLKTFQECGVFKAD